MERRLKIVLAALAVVALVFIGTKYLLEYCGPFMLAILIAAVIDPFVNLLEGRLKLSRGWATLIVLLFFLALVILLLTIMVTNLTAELTHLVSLLPRYRVIGRRDQRSDCLVGASLCRNLRADSNPMVEIVRLDFDRVVDTIRMLTARFWEV